MVNSIGSVALMVVAPTVVCFAFVLKLTPEEIEFLSTNSSAALNSFEKVSGSIGTCQIQIPSQHEVPVLEYRLHHYMLTGIV